MALAREDRLIIQSSTESVRALAARLGVSPTTVQKWRSGAPADHHARARPRRDTLPPHEIIALIILRRAALLSLDDALTVSRPWSSGLSRSSLSRIWQDAGLGKMRRCYADLDRWPRHLRTLGHFYITRLRFGVGPSHLQSTIATDRRSHAITLRVERSEVFPGGIVVELATRFHARSVLYDSALAPRINQFDRELIQSSISENLSAPWTSEQIARSDAFVCRLGEVIAEDAFGDVSTFVRRVVDAVNLTPLKVLRGKMPTTWLG